MVTTATSQLPQVLKKFENEILSDWVREQTTSSSYRPDLMKEAELREQSRGFLNLLQNTLQKVSANNVNAPEWNEVRDYLTSISRSRTMRGFSPTETATFVFSLKQPLFTKINKEFEETEAMKEVWNVTTLIDKLGLFTTEIYQKTREEIIQRQQTEMLELSTPVVKLWEGVLALPMIGTLDSARTQVVMEALLQKIVETGSVIAIMDITGVPTVDTLVAQHLLKTVAAARLMGADVIISGIRPQIAQTMVHLAIDMSEVTTKSTLADAFRTALEKIGQSINKPKSKLNFTRKE